MIEVKRSNLNEIYQFVDSVQLNKITNPEVRKLVIKLVLEGKKNIDNTRKETEDVRAKYFDNFKSEDLEAFQNGLNEMSTLFRQNQVQEALNKDAELSEKYPEITEAFKGFNQTVAELQDESISIQVDPVSIEDFIDAMVGQNIEFTGKEIDRFNWIFKNDSEN